MNAIDVPGPSGEWVFVLDLPGRHSADPLVLTSHAFVDLRESHAILSTGLAIEEKYEVLLSNYEDFEKEILSGALGAYLRHPDGYAEMRGVSLGLNKRLVNFLSAARLYTDHIQHHVSAIVLPGEGECGPFRKLWKKQYDQHVEFRFMEGLRNYVQHRGFPIYETTWQHWWELPLGPASRLVSGIAVSALKKRLIEDKKFKRSVLDEVSEKIDLKAMARRYMECLNEIHVEVREMTSKQLARARETFMRHISLGQARYGCEHTVFEARCRDNEGLNKPGEEFIPIMLEWDDVRVELSVKNRRLINLHRQYATGEIRTKS